MNNPFKKCPVCGGYHKHADPVKVSRFVGVCTFIGFLVFIIVMVSLLEGNI